jgi:predicted Ser/Thr protein kinase
MLARGGMAVVYLARQPALDREVALKRLDFDGDDPGRAQRFVREARLAATLDHPNVVTLFDFFEDGGVPYIAMEYVRGGSLRPLVGGLGLPQIFSVIEGMLAGLAHAEEHGIAHRDLKPENVLITTRGGVKIADFGIARAYNAVTGELTASGTAIGTPAYMAPEQATNDRVGPYTDLYAVGVVAYELLAGRPPFERPTPVAVLYCHVHETPAPLTEVAPGVPPHVCEWVEWLLSKAPSDRPASATQAWEALEEIAVAGLGPYWRRAAAITPPPPPPPPEEATVGTQLAQISTADPPTRVLRPDRRPSRRRGAIAATAALAGVAVVFGIVAAGSDETNPPAPRQRTATPYDFDGDGKQELVLGMPVAAVRRSDKRGGLVLVQSGLSSKQPPQLITPAAAGLRGSFDSDALFGSGLASADFNRDGWADLAIGTPGKNVVSVLHGSSGGLLRGRPQAIAGARMRLPSGAGRYGYRLAARDFNKDGFGDLVVGAPGVQSAPASGAVQLFFGSPAGLRIDRPRTIRRPDDTYVEFGSRLRAGDINGDGNLDLVAGSPDRPEAPSSGHAVYCRGRPTGPTTCRPLGDDAGGGTSSLAVADVNGDGRDDIVQGDADPVPAEVLVSGGEIRLWHGGKRGPAGAPLVIDQASPYIGGDDEPGDEFGGTLDAGDVDDDGYADMIVGAPGENEDTGAVTVIRGARDGWARTGNSVFGRSQPGVPGDGAPGDLFGWSVGLLSVSDDDRLDLAVIVGGDDRLADAIVVFKGGPGVFAPGETEALRLRRLDDDVARPKINRIRIGRPGDS